MVFIVSKLLQVCCNNRISIVQMVTWNYCEKSFCLQLFLGFPGDNVTFANSEVLILCSPSNCSIWYWALSTHCCAYNPWHSLSVSPWGICQICFALTNPSFTAFLYSILCNVFIMLNFILLPLSTMAFPAKVLDDSKLDYSAITRNTELLA